MLKDELSIHQLTEIRRVDIDASKDSGGQNEIYQSRICYISNDGMLDMTIPQMMEKEVNLDRNIRYSFLFMHESAMKTAQGVFIQRIRVDNVPMIRVRLVTQLRKIQRRDYYRLGCNIDLLLQVVRIRPTEIDDPQIIIKTEENLDDDAWKSGTILDISGGGLKFVSEAPIMDLPYVYFRFFLDTDGERKLVQNIGKILSRQPVPRSLSCTYRVKFTPEHTKAQDEILAFIYSRQRKLARRETGR